MFTNTFLFNSRKTFSSRLSQRKAFPQDSLSWRGLHAEWLSAMVLSSLPAGEGASSVALRGSEGHLDEGAICLNSAVQRLLPTMALTSWHHGR